MKAVTVLAIMGILVGSYLGGKITNTGMVEYEYAEVYDAVGQCEEGTFMGGCSDCKTCDRYMYNGGGCSYFKDTLCVLCEPITNCGRVESDTGKMIPAVVCNDGFDEFCVLCEDGYWDIDCKPCKVCPAGFYETVQCTQSNDTECEQCTDCTAGLDGSPDEFVATACTYVSDTVCETCTVCEIGKFSQVECQNQAVAPANDGTPGQAGVYTVTDDTVCKDCTEPCQDFEFTEMTCTATADTVIQSAMGAIYDKTGDGKNVQCVGKTVDCQNPNEDDAGKSDKCVESNHCEEGVEYISAYSKSGTALQIGEDLQCKKCKSRPQFHYTVYHCEARLDLNEDGTRAEIAGMGTQSGMTDSLHLKCSTAPGEGKTGSCAPGEYLMSGCQDSSDALCPSCKNIEHCKKENLRCGHEEDLTGFVAYADDATKEREGFKFVDNDDQHKFSMCKPPEGEATGCIDGRYGRQCCYEKSYSACGTMTTRERRADAYGWEGTAADQYSQNESFVSFCLLLCEEFPDCMAFEVEDSGEDFHSSGDRPQGGKGAYCYFKSAYSQLTEDYTQDCYSNTCRQGDNYRDALMYDDPSDLNYNPTLVQQAQFLSSSNGQKSINFIGGSARGSGTIDGAQANRV